MLVECMCMHIIIIDMQSSVEESFVGFDSLNTLYDFPQTPDLMVEAPKWHACVVQHVPGLP